MLEINMKLIISPEHRKNYKVVASNYFASSLVVTICKFFFEKNIDKQLQGCQTLKELREFWFFFNSEKLSKVYNLEWYLAPVFDKKITFIYFLVLV